MPLFKKGLPANHAALAMIGAKAAQNVLFIGAGDPDLAASVALVTGLNGRTVVVARAPGAAPRVEAAAAKAGALVEFVDAPPAMLPLDSGTFDVVVVHDRLAGHAQERGAIVAEAARAVRSGGRVLIIEAARRPGLFAALSGGQPLLDDATALALLTDARLTAVRHLSTVDGIAYFEGRR
jgi:ubiquinone/menaquinone biosynthesis C-methylase UbiE